MENASGSLQVTSTPVSGALDLVWIRVPQAWTFGGRCRDPARWRRSPVRSANSTSREGPTRLSRITSSGRRPSDARQHLVDDSLEISPGDVRRQTPDERVQLQDGTCSHQFDRLLDGEDDVAATFFA
jgi:hypothetical protein